jgi:hypothetical protein
MQSLSPDYPANIALRQSQQVFAELWLRMLTLPHNRFLFHQS